MDKQIIISIGREYGSAGHEIGRKLAAKLEIPFYDRNLLDEFADQKDVDADLLAKYDEKPRRFFFSRTVSVRGQSINNSPAQSVADIQFALIKGKAFDDDSFVICGRCADDILKDFPAHFSVFITADYDAKVKRVMEKRNMSEKEAKKTIEKHDKTRRAYHDYFAKTKWGVASSYDLCVNSTVLGIDGTVDMLVDFVKHFLEK
ncbi:AAA family ATPase [Treponema sp. C6A8]|uniref:cytidylate kinase-like family protein n=1 Tax=Treponema sp. C6A8 TaxID=1410609 RepID=UPI000485F57C|nr:cytidylate kinase-like family protein [Treponema sp. C6A8]